MTPGFELVMTLTVEITAPLDLGPIGAGIRRVIPISGGSFEGPAIRGVVMAGGADWNLTRADGIAEIWARYTLCTSDGVMIGVTNAGLVVPESAGGFYARTVPQFEVGDGQYEWLRRSIYIGTLAVAEGGNAVQLEFFRVI